MNKKEAKEFLKNLPGNYVLPSDDLKYIELGSALYVVDRIEPEKQELPEIPQYVADKIEYCNRTGGYTLFNAMDYCFQFTDSASWLEYNQELFTKAYFYGYKINQPKLYTVEIPDPEGFCKICYLCKNDNGKVHIDWSNLEGILLSKRTHLTESEIKKDFEWAWKWAKPVEDYHV